MEIEEFIKERVVQVGFASSMLTSDKQLHDEIEKVILSVMALLEWHKQWPVLLEKKPALTSEVSYDSESLVYEMIQQIEWITNEEYKKRFGDQPPATPLLKKIAANWASHPDYNPEWK